MKKALIVALLLGGGLWMVGLPTYIAVAAGIGVLAIAYFGLYHRLVGTGAAVVFVWGLAVTLFGVPGFNDLANKNWDDVAKAETPFKKQMPIDKKLAELAKLRDAGTITPAEFDALRAEVLRNFVSSE